MVTLRSPAPASPHRPPHRSQHTASDGGDGDRKYVCRWIFPTGHWLDDNQPSTLKPTAMTSADDEACFSPASLSTNLYPNHSVSPLLTLVPNTRQTLSASGSHLLATLAPTTSPRPTQPSPPPTPSTPSTTHSKCPRPRPPCISTLAVCKVPLTNAPPPAAKRSSATY